ncbi:hypothetical protein ABZV91_26855 [Nocardia sp. NPDC004568]|uniref:hypothetical protein n=1 Tax=Nocardia sp. NPDC004568 TaxID=3154551 RepID=UPI0033A47EE4
MIATSAPEGEHLPAPRPLLLSLRPRFAQAILAGTKTVELRRTRVAAPPGTLLILYASSPVMAILGVATLADRETASPDTIWHRYHASLGLSRAEFFEYFAGAEHATAISVLTPRTLPEPLTLSRLRAHTAFQPPQSYRYITPADPTPLAELAMAWSS